MIGNTEHTFMPPLNRVKKAIAQRKDLLRAQGIVQHSVITFGSSHATATCVPFNAVVEGNRTGEVRGSISDSDGRQKHQDEENTATRKKLQHVALELQQALERLRNKDKEEQKLRRKLAITQLKLAEAVERRKLVVDNLCDLMPLCAKRACGANAELCRLLQQVKQERDNAVERLHEERAAMAKQKDAEKELKALRLENDTLRQQLEETRASEAKLKEICTQQQGENNESEFGFSRLMHELESDLMRSQAQLQIVTKELTEARSTIASIDVLVQQVRLFVQLICRPDFYVVKDASLEPVDKHRPGPTGFVLVPLTVLLQGYTLLSVDERHGLIEFYQTYL